jgi:hypothetical protein
MAGDEIRAINVHHTLVIPIALQHFRTKNKETFIREAIVFEKYRFLNQRKSPIDSRRWPFPAPQIGVSIIRIYLARPIYAIHNHSPNCDYFLIVMRSIRSSTITNHEKLRRLSSPDTLQYLPSQIRPVKDN